MSGIIRTKPLQAGQAQGLSLVRNVSVQQTSSSRELLRALQEGDVGDVRRVLMNDSEGLRKALKSASLETEYGLRSPLMAAAAKGDGSIYSTMHKAIHRACLVDEQGRELAPKTSSIQFRYEMRKQLSFRDKYGMTLTMLAVRSGSLVIIRSVLQDIGDIEVFNFLTDGDHFQGQSVLAHAAASGNGAVVQAVLECLEAHFHEIEIAEQLTRTSGNHRTLLMTAAASKSHMTFSTCVKATLEYIHPCELVDVVKARDSDGMTFIMHACTRRGAYPDILSLEPAQQRIFYAPGVLQVTRDADEKPSRRRLAKTQSFPYADARTPVTKESGRGSPQQYSPMQRTGSYDSPQRREAKEVDRVHAKSGRVATSRARGEDSNAVAGANARLEDGTLGLERDDWNEYIERRKNPQAALDPGVPVVKAAIAFLQQCLWKDQVRDELKETDSWGRSIITHAIISGSKQIFEVTFDSIRQLVLAEEVGPLLESGNDEEETPTALALRSGEKGLEAAVSRAVHNLKRDVELRAKASTIEAKIQSFIPGKLIVIFQLLLPELKQQAGEDAALTLLLVMCAFAPILSWASGLLNFGQREGGGETYKPRTSFVSYMLSAPAMFVWGVGTSNIGLDSFGWEESLSAAILAVGTIVIPAADAFGNSARLNQWNDQFSCSKWHFERKRLATWNKTRDKRVARVKRLQGRLEKSLDKEEERGKDPRGGQDDSKLGTPPSKSGTPVDESVGEYKVGGRNEELSTHVEEEVED